MTSQTKRRSTIATALISLVGLLVLAGSVFAVFSGLRLVPVLTGSMAPDYNPGTLVVTQHKVVTDIKVGDVIAFRPPEQFDPEGDRPIMHRVTRIDRVDGRLVAVTRGDSNPAPDPWLLSLDDMKVQEAVADIPVAGRLTAALVGASHVVAAISIAGIVLLGSALLLWPRTPRCRVC